MGMTNVATMTIATIRIWKSKWNISLDILDKLKQVWTSLDHCEIGSSGKWVWQLWPQWQLLRLGSENEKKIDKFGHFGQVWTSLDQFGQVWTSLNQFGLI